MARRADVILALATNAHKSIASNESNTLEEVCNSDDYDSNLKSAEEGVENNKVDGLFESLEGKQCF